MDNSILVSVIVPVYNVESYIMKCLDSIINQTYKNIEIILVDDGSTDASGIICDEYQKKDDRITVIHKSNEGLVKTRKKGFDMSHGDYICIIDSDDYVDLEMIEEMLENILTTNADFVHTGTILESNGNITVDCRFDEQVIDNPKDNMQIWRELLGLDNKNYINRGLARKFFKRDLIINCYSKTSDAVSFGEDFITTSRCIIEAKRISLFKKAYYHYCIRNSSITGTKGIERIYMAVLQFRELQKVLIEYNMTDYIGDLVEKACTQETLTAIAMSRFFPKEILLYRFPEINILRNKRIVIYGAGKVGYNYYRQISNHVDIDIVAIADSAPEKYNYNEFSIISKNSIANIEFDIILIAVNNQTVSDKIRMELVQLGVKDEMIIWQKPLDTLSVR